MNKPMDCEPEGSKKRKKNRTHNSKRRKPKSISPHVVDAGQFENNLDEIVSYLSETLKLESSTSTQDDICTDRKVESNHTMSSCKKKIQTERYVVVPSTSTQPVNSYVKNSKVKKPGSPVHCSIKTDCNDSVSRKALFKVKKNHENDPHHFCEDVNKHGAVGSIANNNGDRKNVRKSVRNKNIEETMLLFNEIEELLKSSDDEWCNTLLEDTTEISERDELIRNVANSLILKSKQKKNRKKKKKDKNVQRAPQTVKDSNSDPEGFDGRARVFENSKMSRHNSSRQEDASSQEGCSDLPPSPCKSNEMLKRNRRNMLFPLYMNRQELECISRLGMLQSGFIRINQRNFKEAYITASDNGSDILIEGLVDRNRALEGDEVYYVLKNKRHFRINAESGEVQRTGVVIALKNKNHSRGGVGVIKPAKNQSKYAIFCPRDYRIPRMRIAKKNLPPGFEEDPSSFSRKLYYAKIKSWADTRFADGEITREVGRIGNIEAETSAILMALDLKVAPYTDYLKSFLPPTPYLISLEDTAAREDLRKECVFTIDPATAQDLDDAVSCKLLPNGNYLVGVHISDVSYFLRDGSPLDDAVCERATTIYLVQEVYHMLPRELCELCSLTPGEDKLSFSVIWELTPKAEIVSYHFAKSVINSCGKFSYEQVQDVIDGSDGARLPNIYGYHEEKHIKSSIRALNSLAIQLRKKRFDGGALSLGQTKIVFTLTEDGLPDNYYVYINKESHRLIEEFMLLANITVAGMIALCFPKIAFLRAHPPPSQILLQRMQRELKNYGIELDISSAKSLNSCIVKYNGTDPDSVARMMVLNTLLAKPMTRANYYCSKFYTDREDRRHYALNVELYTHFTSPIRRYADVMVHRLLAAALGYRKPPNWTPQLVQKIADHCNKRKYAAKLAGEKSTELYLTIHTIQRSPVVCDAVVFDVRERALDCIIIETGSKHRVYFESIKAKYVLEKENGPMRLNVSWPRTQCQEEKVQVIQIFSIVKLELKKSSQPNKITARLIRID